MNDPFTLSTALEMAGTGNVPTNRPGWWDVFGANLQENFSPVGLYYTLFGDDSRAPDYDPLNDPALLHIPADQRWRFSESPNPATTWREVQEFKTELANREVFEQASTAQILSSGAAAILLDPINYLDLLVTRGAATMQDAGRVMRAAAKAKNMRRLKQASKIGGRAALKRGALVGALEQGITEVELQNRLKMRSWEESTLAIAGSTLFSALVGRASWAIEEGAARRAAREMMAIEDFAELSQRATDDLNKIIEARGLDPMTQEEEIVRIFNDEVLAGLRPDILEFKKSPLGKILPERVKLYAMNKLGPGMRASLSDLEAMRVYVHNISSLPFERVNAPDIVRGVTALEIQRFHWEGQLAQVLLAHEDAFARLNTKLNAEEFDRVLSEALRNNDKIDLETARPFVRNIGQDEIDAINEVAKIYREAYDAVEALAEPLGALEDLQTRARLKGTARSYLTRQYDVSAIIARPEDFRALLRAYGEQNMGEINERIIDRTIDKIRGFESGGMHVNITHSDPLAGRTLEIPEDFATVVDGREIRFTDFLVNNPKKLLEAVNRNVMPRLLHAQRFMPAGSLGAANDMLESLRRTTAKIAREVGESDSDAIKAFGRDLDDLSLRAHDERILASLAETPTTADMRADYASLAPFRRKIRRQLSELAEKERSHKELVEIMKKRGVAQSAIDKTQAVVDRSRESRLFLKKQEESLNARLREIGREAKIVDPMLAEFRAPQSKAVVDKVDVLDRLTEVEDQIIASRRFLFDKGTSIRRFEKNIDREIDARVAAATSDKEIIRLEKQRHNAKEDLRIMHRRFMNMPDPKANPEGMITRGSNFLRTWSVLSKMGGVTVSSAPDTGLGILVHGYRNWAKSMQVQMNDWRALLPTLKNSPDLQDRMAKMVYGYEVTMGATRMERLAGFEEYRNIGLNAAERGAKKLREGFGNTTGITWWNSRMRVFSATQAQVRLIDDVDAWAAGTIDPKRLAQLKANRITEADLDRWKRMLDKNREVVPIEDTKSVYTWARVDKWKDMRARQKWEESVLQFSQQSLIDVGVGDLPRVFDDPLGAAMFQFKSFSIAATQRTLIAGLQRMDAQVARQLSALFLFGGMTHIMKELLAGRDPFDETPAQFAVNAIDRSGALGILTDINAILERATFGKLGMSPLIGAEGVKRYSERDLADAVLGPNLATLNSLLSVGTLPFRAADKGITKGDINTIRRSLPYQNLFYTRLIMDKLQAGINNSMGLQ